MENEKYPSYREMEDAKKLFYESKGVDSLEKQANLAINGLIWAHYWRAREFLEKSRATNKKLKLIRGKKYYKYYVLDIDHYTNHWLAANGERLLGKELMKTIEQIYGYKPEQNKYMAEGCSSYIFGDV